MSDELDESPKEELTYDIYFHVTAFVDRVIVTERENKPLLATIVVSTYTCDNLLKMRAQALDMVAYGEVAESIVETCREAAINRKKLHFSGVPIKQTHKPYATRLVIVRVD